MKEMEEKPKTVARLMVLKERHTWATERQQLLNDKRKLSDTEAANSSKEMT